MKKTKRILYIILVVVVATVLMISPVVSASAETVSNPGSLGSDLDTTQFMSFTGVGTVVPCFEYELQQTYNSNTTVLNFTVCGVIGRYGDYGDESYYYDNDKIVIILKNTYTGSSFSAYTFWRIVERDSTGIFSLMLNSTTNVSNWYTVGYGATVMWQPVRPYFDNLDILFSSSEDFSMNVMDTFIPSVTTICKKTTTTDIVKWSSTYRYGVSNTNNIFDFSVQSISSTYSSDNGSLYWFLGNKYVSMLGIAPTSATQSTYITSRSQIAADKNLSLYLGTGFYNQYHVEEAYSQGYQAGKAAVAEDLTGFGVITGALTSVMEVLNMKVFGYFSLGDVISVALVFGVVFFVFKLIRG